MSKKVCWSCQGEGTGKWCQVCAESDLDAFGLPHADGKEGTWIQTWSGKQLWPLSPTEDALDVMDCAIGMSRENRYGKQTVRSYKVAEHVVVVSRLAERFAIRGGLSAEDTLNLAREGLFHDCDEGYLPDMPRPIKHEPAMQMGPFRTAGKRIQECMYRKLGIISTPESHAIIDTIDKRLVLDEVRQAMRNPELYLERHGHLKPCGVTLQCLNEAEALGLFLARFDELFPQHAEIDIGTSTFLP